MRTLQVHPSTQKKLIISLQIFALGYFSPYCSPWQTFAPRFDLEENKAHSHAHSYKVTCVFPTTKRKSPWLIMTKGITQNCIKASFNVINNHCIPQTITNRSCDAVIRLEPFASGRVLYRRIWKKIATCCDLD